MVVAAVTYSQIFAEPNELDPIAACQRTDTRGTCDMTKLAAVALPRSYCLGTQCSADIPVTPDQWDRVLFISYPGICELRRLLTGAGRPCPCPRELLLTSVSPSLQAGTYPRGPDFFYNATAWPPVLANIRLDSEQLASCSFCACAATCFQSAHSCRSRHPAVLSCCAA